MLSRHPDIFKESDYLLFKQNSFQDNQLTLGQHETIDDEIREKNEEEERHRSEIEHKAAET